MIRGQHFGSGLVVGLESPVGSRQLRTGAQISNDGACRVKDPARDVDSVVEVVQQLFPMEVNIPKQILSVPPRVLNVFVDHSFIS